MISAKQAMALSTIDKRQLEIIKANLEIAIKDAAAKGEYSTLFEFTPAEFVAFEAYLIDLGYKVTLVSTRCNQYCISWK